MANEKSTPPAPGVGGEKKPWLQIGSAGCFDTKANGAARTTKQGNKYHQGRGTVTVNGVTVEVVVTVMPSRPGMVSVFIEQPPTT